MHMVNIVQKYLLKFSFSLSMIGMGLFSYAAEAEKLDKDSLKIISGTTTFLQMDTMQKESEFISDEEMQEVSFEEFLDSLFVGVDTFAWNNKMINSGRFNSKDMKDTVMFFFCDTAGMKFVMPFKNYVTSNFGPRRYRYHYGIDIKVNKGDTILAAMDGVVRVTKVDRRGYGKVTAIRHANGLETIYGHFSKILVEPNQKVKAGEPIGLGGNTGRSTGSHLHFEMRYLGEPFDPNCFIDFKNYTLKTDTLAISFNNFEYLVDIRKAKYHKIRKGDNLGSIALRYGTTVSKLCKLNNMSRKSILRIGRPIRYQ